MTGAGLDVVLQRNVLRLTVDRPAAKNAIDEALARAIEAALDRASDDENVRCVVLAATGDVFLSGGDLKALSQLPNDARGAHAVIALGLRLAAIERCALPVIAAVQGPVYGGGCELLLMTDVAIIDERATINFVHRKMGLVPAWGGCTRLMERVGQFRSADILLTARAVAASEAVDIGLASRVAPAGDALVQAEELAETLARGPREALVAVKRSLLCARHASRGDSIERERKSFRAAWGSTAHQAAMDRFLRR